MTCQECELRLAEGEAGDPVERHLLACAECRALAADLRENAITLAAMREEELCTPKPARWGLAFSLPPGFARRSVAATPLCGAGNPARSGLSGGSRRLWRWIPAAAAALVLLVLALPRRPRDLPPAPAPAVATSPAPIPTPPASAAVPVVRKRPYRTATARERFAPKPAQPEETFMVKMLTPDPDVVVYWIVEPKEKAE